MDVKDSVAIGSLIFSAFAVLITAWVALKGAKPKQLLDSSAAAENFQEIVIKMQKEMEEMRMKIEGKQLRVHMTIEIDKEPIVDRWEWMSKNDVPTKQLPQPPRRSGFGARQ